MRPSSPIGRNHGHAHAGTTRLAHHPGLDGLRGVSVAVVVLFHAGWDWAPGGFLGVSTFFTLSGFLITRLLLDELDRTGRIDLAAFYARRARRILPAALVTLLGIALFGALVASPPQLERLRGDGLAALFQVANWWLLATGSDYAGELGSASPVQHFWSLAIEEQFYLLYPALLSLLWLVGAGKRGLALALAALTLASFCAGFALEASSASNARLYYGSDVRAGEILVGALLAVVLGQGAGKADAPRSHTGVAWLCGAAGLAVCVAFWCRLPLHDPFLYRGGLALYAAGSLALLVAATRPGPLRRVLSLAPLRWLGRISYGAYLYHWPIFLWLDAARTGLDPLALFALRLALTLGLADLSYRSFEHPIRSGAIRGRGLVALPVAAALAVSVGLVSVTPAPTDPGAEAALEENDTTSATDADRPHILVVGDSVSLEIARALGHWAGSRARVEVNGTRACGIARGGYVGPSASARERECDRWETRWRPGAVPDLVVVVASNWDVFPRRPRGGERIGVPGDERHDAWLRAELGAAHRFLARDGADVVWLTASCRTEKPELEDDGWPPLRETTRHMNERIVRPVALSLGGPDALIDLGARVCPEGRFAEEVDGIRIRHPDGVHFSGPGRRWIAEWLGPQLLERLGAPRLTDHASARRLP